jgi:hypothetical protein
MTTPIKQNPAVEGRASNPSWQRDQNKNTSHKYENQALFVLPLRNNPIFRQQARQLHSHGERAVFELLAEIAEVTGRPYTLAGLLERYAAVPQGTLYTLEIDRIPAPQLQGVPLDGKSI